MACRTTGKAFALRTYNSGEKTASEFHQRTRLKLPMPLYLLTIFPSRHRHEKQQFISHDLSAEYNQVTYSICMQIYHKKYHTGLPNANRAPEKKRLAVHLAPCRMRYQAHRAAQPLIRCTFARYSYESSQTIVRRELMSRGLSDGLTCGASSSGTSR